MCQTLWKHFDEFSVSLFTALKGGHLPHRLIDTRLSLREACKGPQCYSKLTSPAHAWKVRRWPSLFTLRLVPLFGTPKDYSPPGSSVHEISRQEYRSGLPFLCPGNLPDPGIKAAFP